MVILFLCLIGLLDQQHSISKLQTRVNNYQLFILLHAYKQNALTIKCEKCKHKNIMLLYSDTSIFKYSHQIKAMYPTLFSNN